MSLEFYLERDIQFHSPDNNTDADDVSTGVATSPGRETLAQPSGSDVPHQVAAPPSSSDVPPQVAAPQQSCSDLAHQVAALPLDGTSNLPPGGVSKDVTHSEDGFERNVTRLASVQPKLSHPKVGVRVADLIEGRPLSNLDQTITISSSVDSEDMYASDTGVMDTYL